MKFLIKYNMVWPLLCFEDCSCFCLESVMLDVFHLYLWFFKVLCKRQYSLIYIDILKYLYHFSNSREKFAWVDSSGQPKLERPWEHKPPCFELGKKFYFSRLETCSFQIKKTAKKCLNRRFRASKVANFSLLPIIVETVLRSSVNLNYICPCFFTLPYSLFQSWIGGFTNFVF